MINIAVVGVGYWGPNLVRNFGKIEQCRVIAIADIDDKRLELIGRQYPQALLAQSASELLNNPDIDAVAIATPVTTHYPLVKEALIKGKHVLVEKPITETTEQASELIGLAEQVGKVLMVDHTFIYSGPVRTIKELVVRGEIGDILYFDSVRVNLGLFQHDVNVVWDLAPHDFSIMDFILGREPIFISAIGACYVNYGSKPVESMAHIAVGFEGDVLAHFHVNWLSPVKIRRVLIGGSKKMIVYDHLATEEPVKIYDCGVSVQTSDEVYQALIQYRLGDVYAPRVSQTEALEVECQHFVDCIRENKTPITDGNAGLRVVRLLEASQRSLQNKGDRVYLR